MGSALIQTTLFWVFTLDFWIRSDYLHTLNNYDYLTDLYSMPISQTSDLKNEGFWFFLWSQNRSNVCFIIQHSKEKQFKKTHKNENDS